MISIPDCDSGDDGFKSLTSHHQEIIKNELEGINMFTFMFGFACGYGANYIWNRFGSGIKNKVQKFEKEIDKNLNK